MDSETLVSFATAAEAVAIVESRTSGGTMASETPVLISASADAVAIVESGKSFTWELGRSMIGSRALSSTGRTMALEKFVPVAAAAVTCV